MMDLLTGVVIDYMAAQVRSTYQTDHGNECSGSCFVREMASVAPAVLSALPVSSVKRAKNTWASRSLIPPFFQPRVNKW